jgi:hypothetical protein
MSASTYPAYPIDRSSCMTNNGPVDGHFKIPGGTLQYNAERNYFILLLHHFVQLVSHVSRSTNSNTCHAVTHQKFRKMVKK